MFPGHRRAAADAGPSWLGALAVALVALAPSAARAGDWSYGDPDPDEKAFQRWRYSARAGVWVGTFDRPQRACDPTRVFGPTVGLADRGARRAALRTAQFDDVVGFCPHESSDEVGLSAGVDVSYRAFSPLHFTMGIDLVYTEPSARILENQLVVAVPFGVLLTWYEWFLRPILHLTITPVVFVTDVDRDFTMGFDAGLAYRVPELFDLSFTAGRSWSEHVDHWTFSFAFHPL